MPSNQNLLNVWTNKVQNIYLFGSQYSQTYLKVPKKMKNVSTIERP